MYTLISYAMKKLSDKIKDNSFYDIPDGMMCFYRMRILSEKGYLHAHLGCTCT